MTFRTKPQIAAELIRNVAVLGQVGLDWVVETGTNRGLNSGAGFGYAGPDHGR